MALHGDDEIEPAADHRGDLREIMPKVALVLEKDAVQKLHEFLSEKYPAGLSAMSCMAVSIMYLKLKVGASAADIHRAVDAVIEWVES
jgi:hypothetical protein